MNLFTAFILGLLIGWLIEWIIDWVYWRRKSPAGPSQDLENCRNRVAELEQEISSYQYQLASLQLEVDHPATPLGGRPVERSEAISLQEPEKGQVLDSLDEIKGISPEMVVKLNKAGVLTFADLGAMRPQELVDIAGDDLERPGSEVEIVKKARLLSGIIKKVDDLEIIVGIGPVIARTLNQAGIFTFAELSALSVDDLREIFGERIQQLADEESILAQARQLAEKQD